MLKFMTQLLLTAVRSSFKEILLLLLILILLILILLSDTVVIHYRAGLYTGVEDRHIKFTQLAGIYSIDNFNAKGSSFKRKARLQSASNYRLKAVHTRTSYIYGLLYLF